jgi:hypothetical protein
MDEEKDHDMLDGDQEAFDALGTSSEVYKLAAENGYSVESEWTKDYRLYGYAIAKSVNNGRAKSGSVPDLTLRDVLELVFTLPETFPEDCGEDVKFKFQNWKEKHYPQWKQLWKDRIGEFIDGELTNDIERYEKIHGERSQAVSEHDWKLRVVMHKASLAFAEVDLVVEELSGWVSGKKGEERAEQIYNFLDEIEDAERLVGDVAWYDRPPLTDDSQWSEMKAKMIKGLQEEEKKSGEREEQFRAEDEDIQMTEAAHQAKNQLSQTLVPRERGISSQVRETQKKMLPIIWSWWKQEPSRNDMANMTSINARLETMTGTKYKYAVAPTELQMYITNIRREVSSCEENPTISPLELSINVLVFTNILRKIGLDWKMVLPPNMYGKVLQILTRSNDPEIERRRDELEKAILEPFEEQEEFLPQFEVVISSIPKALQGDSSTFDLVKSQLQTLNERAQAINRKIAVKDDDHAFPILELEKLKTLVNSSDQAARLAYTVFLLSIKGHDLLQSNVKLSTDQQRSIKAGVLDIHKPPEKSNPQDPVPCVGTLSDQLLYPNCAEIKTVGWGEHRGIFYINQYGPINTPIWRKEKIPSPGWSEPDAVKPYSKVTNSANRNGDMKDPRTGKKRYGRRHIEGIYGVAFAEDRDNYPDNPEARLDPTNGCTDHVYVLINWDISLNKIYTEKKWEPRTALRERYGKEEADKLIFKAASQSERQFKLWLNGGISNPPLIPDLVESHRYLSPEYQEFQRKQNNNNMSPIHKRNNDEIIDSIETTIVSHEVIQIEFTRLSEVFSNNDLVERAMAMKFGSKWMELL